MRKRSFIFFIALPLFLSLFSCSLQRRHYRSGFYFEKSASAKNVTPAKLKETGNPKINQTSYTYSRFGPLDLKGEPVSENTFHPIKKALQLKKTTAGIHTKPHTGLNLPKPVLQKKFYDDIRRNAVPKAGFRVLVIGLLFLGAAYYSFLHYPDLIYVVIILLFIAAVFILVSLFTSVSGRRDKTNNGKGWRAMALINVFLSILAICALTVFLISLF